MARALVAGLPSPHPLGAHLPAVYQANDATAMALADAFDQVLAPIFASLDNFDAYLDPTLAPTDFVDWLGTWVAAAVDDSWTPARRRELVARATSLYRIRGTRRGLAAQLEVVTGAEVTVTETGGVAWSTEIGQPFPGSPEFGVTVTLRAPEPATVDVTRLNGLVAAAKPAHVTHRVLVANAHQPGPQPAADEGGQQNS